MKIRAEVVVFVLCTVTAAFNAAQAQSLADPTRPPASLGAGAAEGTGEGSSLQSIIRSNRGKPGAIINGEYVPLGGRVGDARLVKIGEDYVTLRTGTETETLMLLPGVEKVPAAHGGQEDKTVRGDRDKGKK